MKKTPKEWFAAPRIKGEKLFGVYKNALRCRECMVGQNVFGFEHAFCNSVKQVKKYRSV